MGFRRIFKNTLFLYAPQLLNPLTSVILVAAIARTHGAEGLGEYSVALTTFFLAESLSRLGLNVPVTRAVATRRETAADYLLVSCVLGMMTAALAFLIVNSGIAFLDYPLVVVKATRIIMWAVFPSVVVAFCQAIFLAFQKAQYIGLASVVENSLKVCIGAVLIVKGAGIDSLFVLILILRVITALAMLSIFRLRISRFTRTFDFGILKDLLRVAPVFGANAVVGVIALRADIIILSKLGSIAQVGLYSAAKRMLQLVLTLPQSFRQALFPAMCEAASQSTESLKRLSFQGVKYMAIVAVAGTVGLYSFADWLIPLLYGTEFAESVKALRIVCLAAIPGSLLLLGVSLLFATKNQAFDLLTNLSRLVAMAVLSFVLVPRYGLVGASCALLGTHIIALLIQQTLITRSVFPLHLPRNLWRPLCAGLLMMGSVYLMSGLSVFVKIPAACVAYAISLLCIGAFSSEEINVAFAWYRKTTSFFLGTKVSLEESAKP